MWGVALIFIAVASCNAELDDVITADLSTSNIESRIIGGSPTFIEKYPFAVQVLYKKEFRCGGSLLSKSHVLTAAHCFFTKEGIPLRVKHVTIRVATTLLNSGGSVHVVKEIIIHKLFDIPSVDNDVAVVVMNTLVDFNTSVARPARIAKKNAVVPNNSSVTAVGWGRTEAVYKDFSPKVLMEVTVRTISLKTCRDLYKNLQPKTGKHSLITNNMICAGIIDVGGKDTCQGDSGGPLLYKGKVVGITSWGYRCADPKYPGVFAKVAKFTNWIKDTEKKSRHEEGIKLDENGSFSNKVGAITLLTPLLYLILSV